MPNHNPDQKLPISVVVCTLNEADNIKECLESIIANNPAEILVIDGRSDDATVELAKQKGALIAITERKGLAYQRYIGVELANQSYVAFIDADDRLDKDALQVSLNELLRFAWKAIAIQSGAFEPTSYWERAMGFLDDEYHNFPGPTVMVGRPALYERDTLLKVGIDKEWGVGIGNEDTDLSIRYEQLNLPMGMGTGKSVRQHPASFRTSFKTWVKYGKGDAKISLKHPQKKKNMLSQVYKKYFGKLTAYALTKKNPQYIPFLWMMGLTRFLTAICYLRVYSKLSSNVTTK